MLKLSALNSPNLHNFITSFGIQVYKIINKLESLDGPTSDVRRHGEVVAVEMETDG